MKIYRVLNVLNRRICVCQVSSTYLLVSGYAQVKKLLDEKNVEELKTFVWGKIVGNPQLGVRVYLGKKSPSSDWS